MENQELKLGIAIIDLQQTIEDENLEKAKELVSYLNNNYIPSEFYEDNHIHLNDCINLFALFKENSPTYEFIINNLNNYKDSDKLIWKYDTQKLIRKFENDDEEIQNLISNFILNNLTKQHLQIWQYNDLIKMSYLIKNYSLLKSIRQKMLFDDEKE